MRSLFLATALLAGCVSTPAHIVQGGVPSTHQSAQVPDAVARCIATNAEGASGEFVVRERQFAQDAFDVTVGIPRDGQGTLAVFHVSRPAESTKISAFIAPRVLGVDSLREAFLKGCL